MSTQLNQSDWIVIYTYPKFEQKIEKELIKIDIETFLPMHEVVRQWSDRKKKLTLPLFPNYLFVRTDSRNRWKVLAIKGVVKFLSNNNQVAFLNELLNTF